MRSIFSKKPKELLYLLLISFAYSVFALFQAFQWYDLGLLKEYDIFFDTDTPSNLMSFAHGWGRYAISHAFIELITIPVRLLEALLSILFLGHQDPMVIREYIALSIAPICTMASTIIIFTILRQLEFKKPESFILSLVFLMGFSNVVFSRLPETFPISQLLLLSSLLALLTIKEKYKYFVLFIVAILATGTTITNIITIFIFLFSYQNTSIRSGVNSSIFCIFVGIIVIASYKLLQLAMGFEMGNEGKPNWILQYLNFDIKVILQNSINMLAAIANSFFSFDYHLNTGTECFDGNGCLKLSLQKPINDLSTIIKSIASLSFILFCLSRIKSQSETEKKISTACLLVISYNVILHSFFGVEAFLYSQHFYFAAFLLLAMCIKNNIKIQLTFLFICTSSALLYKLTSTNLLMG
ncbi:hypothetical protein [Salinibius halmophilus]|uniref:hypothetical protein n=1 Tax=Salinibius halmophilus TaxID=1853216 RepID=UPI000E66FAD8|nr:hypothetical protein [Salinibius halmophilus]